MAKTKPYRKDPSPAHTGLKKYERTFLNRKARRRKKQEKTMQHEAVRPTRTCGAGLTHCNGCGRDFLNLSLIHI